jgi:hypothetical protein
VAEWSAWLAAAGQEQAKPTCWRTPPDAADETPELAMRLLGGVRAGLFALSLAEGEPTLPLDAAAVAAAVGGGAAAVERSIAEGEPPRPRDLDALRQAVSGMLGRARRLHAGR